MTFSATMPAVWSEKTRRTVERCGLANNMHYDSASRGSAIRRSEDWRNRDVQVDRRNRFEHRAMETAARTFAQWEFASKLTSNTPLWRSKCDSASLTTGGKRSVRRDQQVCFCGALGAHPEMRWIRRAHAVWEDVNCFADVLRTDFTLILRAGIAGTLQAEPDPSKRSEKTWSGKTSKAARNTGHGTSLAHR